MASSGRNTKVSVAQRAVQVPGGRAGADGPSEDSAKYQRIDLPFAGVSVATGFTATPASLGVPSRPALSQIGQPVKISLNCHTVEAFPSSDTKIYQYDVEFRSESVSSMKRGLMKKLWESATVQQKLKGFLWDGNKLAWSLVDLASRKSDSIKVDLDQEEKRTHKAGRENMNIHHVHLRQTKTISLASLEQHISGKGDFNEHVLQALNFFDHLLRETPSRTLFQHKRSFFRREGNWKALTGGVEAWKGVYQSIRIAHFLRGQTNSARLVINVDVSNGMFFEANRLHLTAVAISGARDPMDLQNQIERFGDRGPAGKAIRRLRKVRVVASHRKGHLDEYVIDSIIFASAKTHKIEVTGPSGNKVWMTVYDYFTKKYNTRLQFPNLPLIKNNKGAVLPMEVLKIMDNQRYPFKLDERQTSNMITFAATPPQERNQSIQNGLQMLNWAQDPLLREYGVRINPNKTVVEGRLLAAPEVRYGQGVAKPGTSGRWDLKGKKFLAANPQPLRSWGVCIMGGGRGKADTAVVDHFIKAFIQSYIQYGGRVEQKSPVRLEGNINDPGAAVQSIWNAAGNQANHRPQMLLFILPDKNSTTYGRIKRSADCRYGVVSQCMQYAHVQKCQPQYIANVLMKFNAKLGGITCRAVGRQSGGPGGMLLRPTIIIGADVSHAAPGAATPSMAALTCSQDPLATRYAAACETNGFRVEVIDDKNVQTMLKPMIDSWLRVNNNGKLPERIIYFRDGVAEGQYPQILQLEVASLKKALQGYPSGGNVKFIVVVGGKRHHVRFFPEKGDRNSNPLPGTLVETGITNPFENDFYLCSHAAIKGTARPMHYHVLLNEVNMSNNELQTLIYEHSYQYMRATTPVSQHPAIYYAHLASNRAIPHDPQYMITPSEADKKKPKEDSTTIPLDVPLLTPMPNEGGIQTSMWYI